MIQDRFEEVVQYLKRIGYKDTTITTVQEVWHAMQEGLKIPHGVIGFYAKEYLKAIKLTAIYFAYCFNPFGVV